MIRKVAYHFVMTTSVFRAFTIGYNCEKRDKEERKKDTDVSRLHILLRVEK